MNKPAAQTKQATKYLYEQSYPTTTTTALIYDTDGDDITDFKDNCTTVCNLQQLDADRDGIADVCETDPGCGGCSGKQSEEACPSPNIQKIE